MADMESSQQSTNSNTETENIIYLWKIPIDRDYVKSVNSILRVVAAFLSLIAFICCASGRSDNCDDDYSSTYNFFEFMAINTFLSIMVMWLFFALTIATRTFFKLVPWKFGYFIGTIVYATLYLIADICLAAQACGKGNNKAGAAFGFFVLFCLCGDIFLMYRDGYHIRPKSSNSANKAPDYDPDTNMQKEQY